MRWWMWLLIVWGGLSFAGALTLGAVAAKARMRERMQRRRHYEAVSGSQ